MSPRRDLAALLGPLVESLLWGDEGDLKPWTFYGAPVSTDGPTDAPMVVVETWTETRSAQVRGGTLRPAEFELVLAVPAQLSPDADDALDDAWDTLRAVLDDLAGTSMVRWSKAERATFLGAFVSYRIALTITTT